MPATATTTYSKTVAPGTADAADDDGDGDENEDDDESWHRGLRWVF